MHGSLGCRTLLARNWCSRRKEWLISIGSVELELNLCCKGMGISLNSTYWIMNFMDEKEFFCSNYPSHRMDAMASIRFVVILYLWQKLSYFCRWCYFALKIPTSHKKWALYTYSNYPLQLKIYAVSLWKWFKYISWACLNLAEHVMCKCSNFGLEQKMF